MIAVAQRLLTAAKAAETPAFIADASIAAAQYSKLSSVFTAVKPEIIYPVKTNPSLQIISALHTAGSSFHAASLGEAAKLRQRGITAARILAYNPSFNAADFASLRKLGIRRFVLDSVAQHAEVRDADPVSFRMRIAAKPRHDRYPSAGLGETAATLQRYLSKKFRGKKVGIHTHLSSQALDREAWRNNAAAALKLCLQLQNAGVHVTMLNIGGGFPVQYTEPVPSLEQIWARISKPLIAAKQAGISIAVEPGRYLTAPTSVLVSSVKLVKNSTLFLDSSIYSAYLDTRIADILLPAIALKKEKAANSYTLRGKGSCSLDVFGTARLPKMRQGDRIAFLNAGAYIISSDFMGFGKTATKHL